MRPEIIPESLDVALAIANIMTEGNETPMPTPSNSIAGKIVVT